MPIRNAIAAERQVLPVIVCNHCKKPIAKHDEGIVTWRLRDGDPHFLHKGTCDHVFWEHVNDIPFRGKCRQWYGSVCVPLGDWIRELARNAGIRNSEEWRKIANARREGSLVQ